MFYKPIITFVVALALVVGSMPLIAQTTTPDKLTTNVPALLVRANQAYAAGDYLDFRVALEELHKLRPNNSQYMYQLVIAHALLDEKSQAYDLMLRMQKQGLAYDFTESDDTQNIRDTEVFDYVNNLMKTAAEPMGESEAAFVLPQNVKLPEAISWDESRQKFLVGTIAEGRILAVDKDGQVDELIRADDENGLWAILDILVDQPRNRLWVTSASVPDFAHFDPIDKGRSALFEFNLETLELIHRYPVPVDGNSHVLGNMALGPDGGLYAADRVLPLIYYKPAGENRLKPVLALRDMVSLRGLAMQPDGRIMYVAGREMGIMVVDLKARQARLLEAPATLNLAGIDGLYRVDNSLVILQNGIMPQRVMRLDLDASGTKIATVRPLAVAQPEFDFPSFGAIEGGNLYYFASSQGIGKTGVEKAVTVLRTPLTAGDELVQPDMQQFLKQQAELNKQREKEDGNN
ncbi:MAG: hypothetical protein WBS20_13470 [Lysobacterales bacterium]